MIIFKLFLLLLKTKVYEKSRNTIKLVFQYIILYLNFLFKTLLISKLFTEINFSSFFFLGPYSNQYTSKRSRTNDRWTLFKSINSIIRIRKFANQSIATITTTIAK